MVLTAPLPSFGGFAFFKTVVAQKHSSCGSLLQVPCCAASVTVQDEPTAAAAAAATCWAEAASLLQPEGLEQIQVSAVVAQMPRSKVEKATTKQSWAALFKQVQPAVLPCSSASVLSEVTATAAIPVDSRHQAGPSIRPFTMQKPVIRHMDNFWHASSHADGMSARDNGTADSPSLQSCMDEASMLDVPLLSAAQMPSVAQQDPNSLFHQSEELQQLWQQLPEVMPDPAVFEAAQIKVHRLPLPGFTEPTAFAVPDAANSSSGSSKVAAAAVPITASPGQAPTLKQLVQGWMKNRHRHHSCSSTNAQDCNAQDPDNAVQQRQQQHDAGEPAAAMLPAEPQLEQTRLQADMQQAAGDPAAEGSPHPDLAAAGLAPNGLLAAQAVSGTAPTEQQQVLLEVPALPYAVLKDQHVQQQPQQHTTLSDGAPASQSVLYEAVKQHVDQEGMNASMRAAAGDASCIIPEAASSWAQQLPGLACLEAQTAERMTAITGSKRGSIPAQQQLMLPVSALPSAVHMPAHHTTTAPDGHFGCVKQQHSLNQQLLGWLATKKQSGASRKHRGPAEGLVPKHQPATAPSQQQQDQQQCIGSAVAQVQRQSRKPSIISKRKRRDSNIAAANPAAAVSDVVATAAEAAEAVAGAGTAAAPVERPSRSAEKADPSQTSKQEHQQGTASRFQLSSPSSLMIEVPVCIPDKKPNPLSAQLLSEALYVAGMVLQLPSPEDHCTADSILTGSQPAGASIGNGCADGARSMQQVPSAAWDGTWGLLCPQTSAAATTGHALPALGGTSSPAVPVPWWSSQAAVSMLSCAHFQHQAGSAAAASTAGCEQGAGTAAATDGPVCAASSHTQHQQLLQGEALLGQMLAADMQLDDQNGMLLPVMLFSDGSDSSSSGSDGFFEELMAGCAFKRQPTAHLELYFDWSVLQPQQQFPRSRSNKRRSSLLGINMPAGADQTGADTAPTAVKKLKLGCGSSLELPCAAVEGLPSAPPTKDTQAGFDSEAWLATCSRHRGLQQLQAALQRKHVGVATAGTAAVTQDIKQLARAYSNLLLAGFMQPDAVSACAISSAIAACRRAAQGFAPAGGLVCRQSDQRPSTAATEPTAKPAEAVSAEVATTAMHWRRSSSVTGNTISAAPTAGMSASNAEKAAACSPTKPSLAPAPASDMEFFLKVQGLAPQRSSKRRSSIALQHQPGTVEPLPGVISMHAAAAQSPTGQGKRARLSARGQGVVDTQVESADPDALGGTEQFRGMKVPGITGTAGQEQTQGQHKQRQHKQLACVTADLAINRALRGSEAVAKDATAAAATTQLPQPQAITVDVSESILQLLLLLESTRKATLAGMHCPGPDLVQSKLWQDATAQKLLLQLQAGVQQQGPRQPRAPQQKQQAKLLVVLLLLSQTASCLLHYGVRVAHMFLQHGLQRVPSVSNACQPALAALSTAYSALEQLPVAAMTGAGTDTTANTAPAASSKQQLTAADHDHPKLSRLRELMLQLKLSRPGSKLLVIAEAKAFFNLYHTLSAAGIIAVQLDRDKELAQQLGAAATGAGMSAAATATGAGPDDHTGSCSNDAGRAAADSEQRLAWESAVQTAVSSAGCVLATHEQLHHTCMPLQMFDVLIEYIAWEDTAAAATAALEAHGTAGNKNSKAVSAHFGQNRHFSFIVNEPDLHRCICGPRDQAVPASSKHAVAAGGVAAAVTAAAAGHNPALATSMVDAVPAGPVVAPALGAAAVRSPAAAAAAPAAGSTVLAAPAAVELPLVLNRGPGSVLKRRLPLYQSLLQLEAQGYLLVERSLGAGRGGQTAVAAAVDVVISPRACLCIWDKAKVPQDTDAALQLLARTLLALSAAYDTAFFVLELPDSLLQAIMRGSSHLQGLARAVGVKLQLLCCFTASNTQDALLSICKASASSFWNSSSNNSGVSTTDSDGSSRALQPPASMSDIVTPVESGLLACCALNPMSAAVLASQAFNLRSLCESVASGEAANSTAVSACLTANSFKLLQAQVQALQAHIQQQQQQQLHKQQQQQQEAQLRHQYHLQQESEQYQPQRVHQHPQQPAPVNVLEGMPAAPGPHWYEPVQQHEGDAATCQYQQQPYQQQELNSARAQGSVLVPRHRPHMHDRQYVPQQQQLQQEWRDEVGIEGQLPEFSLDGIFDEPQVQQGRQLPAWHSAHLQQHPEPQSQLQPQQWQVDELEDGRHSMQPAEHDQHHQQQQRQHQLDANMLASDIDPSRVLDDFLNSRTTSLDAAGPATRFTAASGPGAANGLKTGTNRGLAAAAGQKHVTWSMSPRLEQSPQTQQHQQQQQARQRHMWLQNQQDMSGMPADRQGPAAMAADHLWVDEVVAQEQGLGNPMFNGMQPLQQPQQRRQQQPQRQWHQHQQQQMQYQQQHQQPVFMSPHGQHQDMQQLQQQHRDHPGMAGEFNMLQTDYTAADASGSSPFGWPDDNLQYHQQYGRQPPSQHTRHDAGFDSFEPTYSPVANVSAGRSGMFSAAARWVQNGQQQWDTEGQVLLPSSGRFVGSTAIAAAGVGSHSNSSFLAHARGSAGLRGSSAGSTAGAARTGIRAWNAMEQRTTSIDGSEDSRLTAPSFMAHHKPSKQLRFTYAKAGAAGGAKKHGHKHSKGRKGGFQTKLCWN